jgi:hypothetical protein
LEYSKSGVKKTNLNDFEKSKFEENLQSALSDMFTYTLEEKQDEYLINVDKKVISVSLKNYAVKCEEDKQLEQIVSVMVNQIKNLS